MVSKTLKNRGKKGSACTKIKNVKKNCTFPCRKVKGKKSTGKKKCRSIFSKHQSAVNPDTNRTIYKPRTKKNKKGNKKTSHSKEHLEKQNEVHLKENDVDEKLEAAPIAEDDLNDASNTKKTNVFQSTYNSMSEYLGNSSSNDDMSQEPIVKTDKSLNMETPEMNTDK